MSMRTQEKQEKQHETQWSYQDFRNYLLNIARSEKQLLPRSKYPAVISLSDEWHELFDKIRRLSAKDGKERFAGIGYIVGEEKSAALILPKEPDIGTKDKIPMEVISAHRSKMLNAGIEGIIGTIHSHPVTLFDSLFLHFMGFLDSPSFSVGDLYGLVAKNTGIKLIIAVEGRSVLLGFASQETMATAIDPHAISRQFFYKYWYEVEGVQDPQQKGLHMKEYIQSHLSLLLSDAQRNINKKITERHFLVMYEGKIGKTLQKE